VRAVDDDRDAAVVEGVLHLRYVPSLNYVQVDVVVDGDGLHSVRPDSIEVVQPDAVAVEDLEAEDPLLDETGWRRIVDLQQAEDEGLLQPPVERVGGSWDDLFDDLRRRVQPLLDAGWTLVSTDREESSGFGDSVFYDLERDDVTIELEYYEHAQLVAYPVGDDEKDDEITEPLFTIAESTLESSRTAFMEQGWLP
jgi:hypothetical protein